MCGYPALSRGHSFLVVILWPRLLYCFQPSSTMSPTRQDILHLFHLGLSILQSLMHCAQLWISLHRHLLQNNNDDNNNKGNNNKTSLVRIEE